MAWSDQLFRYCERGADPTFWAEPVNAVTNLAFVAAALLGARYLWRAPNRSGLVSEAMLVALVFVIGAGSFLFHTFATRWASLADVIPIGLFMLGYFAYALRRFIGLSRPAVVLGVVGFIAALWWAGDISCSPAFLPVSNALELPCLNGTAGYLPALIALLGIGGVLVMRRHAAGTALSVAGAVFFASMAFRTLDFEICRSTVTFGHAIGTHFLWHVLNAIVLFLLLRAALLHGRSANSV